jgi:RNA polymerase sigma-70 factor (ECF subfamily)
MENLSTDAALALIASLPRDQAEVIMLRVVAGLDATAVGVMLGKSPGAVRVTAHRGLRRLQELVGRDSVTL